MIHLRSLTLNCCLTKTSHLLIRVSNQIQAKLTTLRFLSDRTIVSNTCRSCIQRMVLKTFMSDHLSNQLVLPPPTKLKIKIAC